MNVENLVQLSFEQLNEIQRRINTAISEKKNVRVSDATSEILDFLASNYPEIKLREVINELAFRSQISLDNCCGVILESGSILESYVSQKSPDVLERPVQSTNILSERLKNIRNSVLQNDDSRLLWLPNDGTQKTSKMFGKELAEILQEAVKKLERLDSVEEEVEKVQDLSLEIRKIDEWAEFKLGISLLSGTLTVINPFAARQSQITKNPRSSQRSPIAASKSNKASVEITFPFGQRREAINHANL